MTLPGPFSSEDDGTDDEWQQDVEDDVKPGDTKVAIEGENLQGGAGPTPPAKRLRDDEPNEDLEAFAGMRMENVPRTGMDGGSAPRPLSPTLTIPTTVNSSNELGMHLAHLGLRSDEHMRLLVLTSRIFGQQFCIAITSLIYYCPTPLPLQSSTVRPFLLVTSSLASRPPAQPSHPLVSDSQRRRSRPEPASLARTPVPPASALGRRLPYSRGCHGQQPWHPGHCEHFNDRCAWRHPL